MDNQKNKGMVTSIIFEFENGERDAISTQGEKGTEAFTALHNAIIDPVKMKCGDVVGMINTIERGTGGDMTITMSCDVQHVLMTVERIVGVALHSVSDEERVPLMADLLRCYVAGFRNAGLDKSSFIDAVKLIEIQQRKQEEADAKEPEPTVKEQMFVDKNGDTIVAKKVGTNNYVSED